MNKQLYRVIFSQASGTFIAVAETTSAHVKQSQRSKGSAISHPLMRFTTLGVLVAALFGHASFAHAQMVAYKNGAGPRPLIDQSANGRPVVQIVNPNANGLSHNKYDQFNVDGNGVILNNSPSDITTQLGGYVQGNPQINRSANLILNEVLGVNRSVLNGYIEVAGQRAEVIIANPNGISVGNDAGFINTSRGVLTTGTPVFNGDGSLAAFRVTQGDITIDSGGMNATQTDQLDLIARSIKANDAIWANGLNIVTGSNQVDYRSLGATIITGEGGQPTVAIDSSSLGGMYAQKIMLIGTEKGVGVNLTGNLIASAGEIRLDNAGKVILNGNTNATGQITVRADEDIVNNGTTYGQSTVTLKSGGQISNSSTLAAQSDLNLVAATINSTGILAAGIDSTGQSTLPGNLTLTASGQIISTGQHSVGGDMSITGTDINLVGAQTNVGRNVYLQASNGNIDHRNATLNAAGAMSVNATGAIINDGGAITAAQWNSTSNAFSNNGGQLILTGTTNSTLTANTINNSEDGFIGSNGSLTLQSDDIDNTNGTLYADEDMVINASGNSGAFNNTQGVVQANRNLTLNISTINNRHGRIEANGNASTLTVTATSIDNTAGRIANAGSGTTTLTASEQIINQNGTLGGNGDVSLTTAYLDNSNGQTIAAGNLNLDILNTLINRSGNLYAARNLTLNQPASTVDNSQGTINAGGNIDMTLSSLTNNNGKVTAAGDIRLVQSGSGNIANNAGQIAAAHDLDLTANTITGVSTVIADNDATVNLQGDYTNVTGNIISANNRLNFTTTGSFINQGVFQASQALYLTAANITNQNGALINSGTTRLIAQNNVLNQGRIYGDDIAIGAFNIVNDTNAIIASRNTLNLGAATLTNNENATIMSMGDMAIGGAIDGNGQATGQATSVVNNSATIDAGGNLIMNAARLDNLNAHFATETELVSTEYIVDYSFDGVNWYRIGQGATWHDNGDYNLVEIGGRTDKHFYERTYTKTVTQTKVTTSAPGQILANGNITLNVGVVNNQASTIVAGLGLGGSGEELYNNTPQGIIHTTLIGNANQDMGIRYHDTEDCGFRGEKECNRWSGYSTVSDTLPDVAIDLTIWPDGEPDRLSNPANGEHADNNLLPDNNAITIGDGQTVTAPDGQLPNVKLPSNQLFIIVTDPNTNYLVETDPAFTNYKEFLSSDYMLSRMSMNPQQAQKRLGDGYYEQKLVADQVMQLTGKRFLGSYTTTQDEFQALMNNGVQYAEQLGLTPGVPLTTNQIASLTSDMVWLVSQTVTLPNGSTQQVLAPIVYLAKNDTNQTAPTSGMIAAQNLSLDYAKVDNQGTLQASNQLIVNANDITNQGTIQSRNSNGNGTVVLTAANDIVSNGTIDADRAGLTAGRDVTIASTTSTNQGASGEHTGISRVATIDAGQLSIQSGRDTNINAAAVTTTGNATIVAGNNLNLGTVTQTDSIHANFGDEGYLKANSSQTIGSQVQTGGNLAMAAGQDINATATYVNSNGQITAAAGRDINVTAGQQTSSYDNYSHFTSSGLLSSQQVDLVDKGQSQQAVSSTLSGDKVTLVAGRDLTVTGSNVVATHDTTLAAGNNVTITTAENTSSRYYDRQEQKSGLLSTSGGIGVTIGTQENQNTQTNQSTTHTGSTVGSTNGNVTIQAGNAYTQTGSDVIALKGDATVLAKTIDINAVTNTDQGTEDNKFKQSGLTLAVSAPVIQAVQSIRNMADATSKTDDGRMKALGAAVAASSAVDGYKAAQNPTQGVTLSLTVGSSESESHSEYSQSVAQGSNLSAGGNVNLVATGGGIDGSHINVIGSTITAGNDAALISDGKINLEAAQNTSSQHSTSSSSSAAIGVSATYGSGGVAFGVTANASGSRGHADGDDASYTNANVTAGNKMIIASGSDTTLKGALVSGNQVIANVQGNLNMESPQDSSNYNSKDQNIGGSITVGAGAAGSINVGQTKVNGQYQSVGQQTGIAAGDGGFQIDVQGNTDLKGAVIASTQEAIDQNKNSFTSGTLTQSDLQNRSHYDASSFGIGMSVGKQEDGKAQTAQSDAYQVANFTGGMSGTSAGYSSKDGDTRSTTYSGISGNANGTGTTITNDAAQQALTGKTAAETVASINKDITTQTSSNSLTKDWNAQQLKDQVQAGAQITAAFGQMAANRIGTYAKTKQEELQNTDPEEAAKWAEGGEYRIALHTAAGALSGGLAGAAGAFTSATAMTVIGSQIEQMGLPKEVAQGLNQVTAATLGALVGGATGAASGLNVEANNRQLHPDEKHRIKDLANGDPTKEARLTAAACAAVQCYAEYPVDSAAYQQLKQLADIGSSPELAAERQQLANQSGLFNYTTSGLLSDSNIDAAKQLNNTYKIVDRGLGAGQLVLGGAGLAGSVVTAPASCLTGVGCVANAVAGTVSADVAYAGAQQLVSGDPTNTFMTQGLQGLGMSPQAAGLVEAALGIGSAITATSAINSGLDRAAALNKLSAASYQDFMTNGIKMTPEVLATPQTQTLIKEIQAGSPNLPYVDAAKIAQNYIESGATLPQMALANSDSTLIKIVPKGDTVSATTGFWMSPQQAQAIAAMPPEQAGQMLGLPATQAANMFKDGMDFYAITPKSGATPTVFVSNVASTTQGTITMPGGAQQIIVPNRSQWTTPSAINPFTLSR